MNPHIALLMLVLLNGLLFYSSDFKFPHFSGRRNMLFVIASEFWIFLMVGCRASSVGIDTIRYKQYFEQIAYNPGTLDKLDWAFLFRLLVGISEKAHSFQMLLLLCAAINCIGFGYFILSVTDDRSSAFWYIFYFITLGSYFNSMNLMRQFCAMSITINIYAVLRKNQSRKSFLTAALLFVIGLGFHASAILSAVYFIPFLLKKIEKRTIIMFSAAALTVIVVYRGIIFLILHFWERYQKYANDERLTSGQTGVFAITMITLRILMIIIVLSMDAENKENKELYRQTIFTITSTALFILQAQTQFALRIGYYYEILFPLYIPTFIRRYAGKQSRTLLYVLFALYAAAYFIYMMKWGGTRSNRATVPYTFFWAE